MTESTAPPPVALPAVPAVIGRLLNGPRHMERRFARYGEIVPDWAPGARRIMWLRDPELIQQALRSLGVESNTVGRLLGAAVGSTAMLTQLSGERHRAVRRLLMPTLRGDALAHCRSAIAVAASRMADRCPVGAPFRLLPLLDTAVAEANVTACVSVDDPGRLREWATAVLRLRQTSARPLVVLHGLGVLPWYAAGKRARRACLTLVRAEVARRRRTGAAHPDALGHLLACDSPELTDQVLCDQIVFYLFGGQATALAAAWAVERAVRHPHAWRQLADEAAAPDTDAPYTDAVAREALRLRPPVTMIPWLLKEPSRIGGHRLPAGTFVVASLWDLHRRPDLYPDPGEFRPERFLNSRPPRGAWLPFGTGPHACVGAQLALLQIRELLHALARRGHLQPARPRDEGIGHRSSMEIYPAQGCRVLLDAPFRQAGS